MNQRSAERRQGSIISVVCNLRFRESEEFKQIEAIQINIQDKNAFFLKETKQGRAERKAHSHDISLLQRCASAILSMLWYTGIRHEQLVSNQIRPIQIRVGNDLKVVEAQNPLQRGGVHLTMEP